MMGKRSACYEVKPVTNKIGRCLFVTSKGSYLLQRKDNGMKLFTTKYRISCTPWLIVELSDKIGYVSLRLCKRQFEVTLWNNEVDVEYW
jgi:hypothetical protein